jgi:hypothetical protein
VPEAYPQFYRTMVWLSEMNLLKVVVEDHNATYSDPIAVRAGDPIILSGAKDHWDGHLWLWAEGPDGRSGWVPDTIVEQINGKTCAARHYSAAELTCRKGEVVQVTEETHGWAWCCLETDQQGWVPLRNLGYSNPTTPL